MLPADARVRHRAEFRIALRGGRARAQGLLFHLGIDPARGDGSTPRVGVIVSRAVGSAVTRNRVRRRLRHLSILLLPQLPEGSLVVVRALPEAALMSSDELNRSLWSAYRRVRVRTG